jgi:hypothetical protein
LAQNTRFVRSALAAEFPSYDWAHPVLSGHALGGDRSALLASEPDQSIAVLLTLDNRRGQLPRSEKPRVLPIRASELYVGVLDDFFFDSDGNLDRLILQNVARRPLSADKNKAGPEIGTTDERFYDIDGDSFVLRYQDVKTLNVQYVKLTTVTTAESVTEVKG